MKRQRKPLRIVVVEDHDALREATVQLLDLHGHHAIGVPDAESVTDEVTQVLPDLVIVDLNLPGEDGMSLAKRIQSRSPITRIIMMTARDRLVDRVKGYENGADLYLTKPVPREELLAAVAAMARRMTDVTPKGQVKLDATRLKLIGKYTEVGVSKFEALLLSAMLRSADQSVERWQIVQLLKGEAGSISTAGLEMRIGRLRRKLEKAGVGRDSIKPIYGHGYVLCVNVDVMQS